MDKGSGQPQAILCGPGIYTLAEGTVWKMVETLCSGVFLACVGTLALPLTSQVTMGKSLYIFGSQFPHLYNGDNNGTDLMGLL